MRVVLCQGVKTRWLVRHALDGGLDVGRIIETVLRHAGLLEDGERIADAALALTVEHQYLDIAGPCLFQDEQRFFEGQGFSLLDNEGAMRGKDRGGIEGVTRGNIACQRLALCQQASRAIVAGQDGDLTPLFAGHEHGIFHALDGLGHATPPGQDSQRGLVLGQHRVGVGIGAITRGCPLGKGGYRGALVELVGQLGDGQFVEQVDIGGEDPFFLVERDEALAPNRLLDTLAGLGDQPLFGRELAHRGGQ